jgi:hypothetical protein
VQCDEGVAEPIDCPHRPVDGVIGQYGRRCELVIALQQRVDGVIQALRHPLRHLRDVIADPGQVLFESFFVVAHPCRSGVGLLFGSGTRNRLGGLVRVR